MATQSIARQGPVIRSPEVDAVRRSLQKETGHRFTSTSGQELAELYSPNEDSKVAEPIFCDTRR
jgi:hypothetical protein